LPETAIRAGSSWYVVAFLRSHRMAALASCSCAGKVACRLDRTEIPTTA
jgi:hypothetical protein